MRIQGIICEFDPFHNGHMRLLEQGRAATHADATVCVMSGHFTQRGRPALWDKWTRAKMALACGADVVAELPAACAVQSAERFAAAGVSLLDALGADYICFGSEAGELDALWPAARWLAGGAQEQIAVSLAGGMSYAAARADAAKRAGLDAEVLSRPNNILAVEYLAALLRQGSGMQPVTIPREGAGHGAASPEGTYASASYVRGLRDAEQMRPYVPDAVYHILREHPPADPSGLEGALLYRLRTMTAADIAGICDVTEGLENRIWDAARRCGSVSALREYIKSKRYAMTRVDRVLTNILLGVPKDMHDVPPGYIRVLGMSKAGSAVLRACKQKGTLPVIVKTADAKLDGMARRMLELDIRASDIWALQCGGPAGRDYTTSPVTTGI